MKPPGEGDEEEGDGGVEEDDGVGGDGVAEDTGGGGHSPTSRGGGGGGAGSVQGLRQVSQCVHRVDEGEGGLSK